MSEDERVAWLREQIAARTETAREACHGTDGHWWRRTWNWGGSGPVEPVGALLAGEPVLDADDEVCGGDYIVVYDEGAPSGEQFAHIAANDPQQVIADCEMQLGIVGLYELWAGQLSPQSAYPELGAAACVASDALRHVASAYRHKPGYAEHWGEPATPTESPSK